MSATIMNDTTFDREVLKAREPVLVDFYADWCGPCQVMLPVIEELGEELSGRARVVKVNVDQAPELAARYQVRSIPNFLVIKDNEVKGRLVGAQAKQALLDTLEPHLN